jgi:hypothetical protein
MGQISRIKDSLVVSQSQSGDLVGQYLSGFPELDLYLGSGTAANQADLFWTDISVSILTATTRNLDLRALTNGPGGAAVDLREIRGIWFRARDFALTLAVGAANGWTALGALFSIVPPAGTWFRVVNPTDGVLPTGAANKVLDLSNASGSTATYDLLIIGTSA